MSSSKHEFSCIFMAAVHIHTSMGYLQISLVQVGHVFIQPVQSKLPVNNNNVMYSLWHIFDIRTDIVKLFIDIGARLVNLSAM